MNISAFYSHIAKLKEIERSGWVEKELPNPESVADHSFGTAFLVMVLAPRLGLDQLKCLKLALVHDMAEAETGDVVTQRGSEVVADHAQKQKNEALAAQKIFSQLGGPEYLALFSEYQAQESEEAKFVRQIDKLEMALQAKHYQETFGKDLSEFLVSASQNFGHGPLRETLEDITMPQS